VRGTSNFPTTGAQLSALNQPINAEVIHAQKIGGFLKGIGKPLRPSGGCLRLRRVTECFHMD
jgi:hypothetical protein